LNIAKLGTPAFIPDFNELIKPRDGSQWSSYNPHDITANRVSGSDGIKLVFARFVVWLACIVSSGYTDIVLGAWNGKACDFDWFFEITDVRHPDEPTLQMPEEVKYYWDTWRTACEFTPRFW
jgi:hypothetical protein